MKLADELHELFLQPFLADASFALNIACWTAMNVERRRMGRT
jgi:hypothetical protein